MEWPAHLPLVRGEGVSGIYSEVNVVRNMARP